jgi:hypothetical protein
LFVLGLDVSVDREDGASGKEELEAGEELSVGLLRDGEILVTGAVMVWSGLADVVVVVAWRIDVD